MKKKIIAILLLLCTGCFAFETQATFPETSFNSVNTHTFSTSYQPNITPVGATSVNGNNAHGTPRRVIGGSGGGHPYDPYPTPVGDFPVPLAIFLIVGYVIITKIRLQTRITPKFGSRHEFLKIRA